MIKKALCLILIVLFMLSMCACGKMYTCGRCSKETSHVYYDAFDPNNPNAYMCDECAAKYYSPFPYKGYEVNR